MNTRNTSRLSMIALALAAALSACSKHEDDRTAGQKLDGAIADAKQAGAEARADTRDAANTAEAKVKDAANATSDAMTDAAIVTKINAALAADDQLKATKIDVDAKDGHVTLSGLAPNSDAQKRATTLAQAVDGVRGVDNKLMVSSNG
ncbi:MAG: BON domain-containing protein [Rubrivivax sp.]|nr:MAG: BON domain-containing protein [Rubrivivax sp.]